MFLNSEPSFSQKAADEKHYIYSGTIEKIMPAALFYGKETHFVERAYCKNHQTLWVTITLFN